jgi:hypothetical protein
METRRMRKLLLSLSVCAGLALSGTAANAGGYYRHHHHHHNGAFVAAGVIGGALLLGAVLSRPRYYGPPPPAPSCVSDRVYRYLPDGSVQWGTRTRCY